MLTDEAKRFLRNWRSDSVNGVLLFGVDEAAKAGLVTWAGLLTPRGADLVATAEAAGYDPDAVQIKCDACQDTGSVREWVDVPIMGEWTVTRERARPCEECDAQAEADRAMIESGVRSADEIRSMRGLLNIDQLLGRGECTQIRFLRAPRDDMPPTLDTSHEPIDMDLYAKMVTTYKRESRLGWAEAMTIDPFAGNASTMVPVKFRPHAEPSADPQPSTPPRMTTAEALANLALTPEPEVIDVPAPVDWIYLDSMRGE